MDEYRHSSSQRTSTQTPHSNAISHCSNLSILAPTVSAFPIQQDFFIRPSSAYQHIDSHDSYGTPAAFTHIAQSLTITDSRALGNAVLLAICARRTISSPVTIIPGTPNGDLDPWLRDEPADRVSTAHRRDVAYGTSNEDLDLGSETSHLMRPALPIVATR